MSVMIFATKPEDLPAIVNVLHDCWFDKDEIQFDPDTAMLTIRFTKPVPERGQSAGEPTLLRRVVVPYFESFLRIRHVRSWSVRDTEQVGLYDFNEIEFDAKRSQIRVTTGIPIGIAIDVEALEVSVEVTETLATGRTRRRLF